MSEQTQGTLAPRRIRLSFAVSLWCLGFGQILSKPARIPFIFGWAVFTGYSVIESLRVYGFRLRAETSQDPFGIRRLEGSDVGAIDRWIRVFLLGGAVLLVVALIAKIVS